MNTGARVIRIFFGILIAVLLVLQPVWATEVTQRQTTTLIMAAETTAKDPAGWATDLLDVLHLHGLPASKENICSAIAVIDQESNFVANPAVAGLGKISEQALRDKFHRVPILGALALQFLETTPGKTDSYMGRIRSARTERDLDMTYRAMVADAAKQSSLGVVVGSGILNTQIEGKNEIDTIGSMQVSVEFAMGVARHRRWLPMSLDDDYAVRDELYSRHGGMYYGVLQLLGYETGYDRKIYRFADYNAGRYSSRNAAFQKQVAVLSGQALARDGDLLLYDKGGTPKKKPSSSEMALRKILPGVDEKQLRSDLLLEKENGFIETQTFNAVRAAYQQKTGTKPAFAIIPEIALSSPKIKHAMTTRNFAESVDRRYQACIARTL
jgi:Protein of unknown function (DUF1615)